MKRPVEALSGTQQIALFATGVIWTRWCLIIKPKNYLLASVNFFLGTVAGYQLSRIYGYQRTLGYSPTDAVMNTSIRKEVGSGGRASESRSKLDYTILCSNLH